MMINGRTDGCMNVWMYVWIVAVIDALRFIMVIFFLFFSSGDVSLSREAIVSCSTRNY